MDAFKDFRALDFLEQVTLLQSVEAQKTAEAIPDLLELHTAPLGDQSVDLAVTNVLQALLAENEAKTVEGLASPSPAVRRLCLRTVGKHEFVSAAPILMDMAEAENDPEGLLDILTSLSRLELPESLPLFRRHFAHAHPLISGLCVQMTGTLKDASALGLLTGLIDEAESESLFEVCPFHVLMAVRALQALDTREAAAYLADKIHHVNPTARRIIHEALIAVGQAAVPEVSRMFETGDVDQRVLAANVLGWIGDKAGADAMIGAMDRRGESDVNVRYAVYEALGRIGALKGLIFLMDGLRESDPLLLLAVVTALDANLNPGVVKKVKEALADPAKAEAVLRAVAASRSVRLFAALYPDPNLAQALMAAVSALADAETAEAFAATIEEIGGDKALADAAALRRAGVPNAAQKRVLAVDDSKAMLHFYRSVLPELGYAAVTAENGQEAWEHLSETGGADLIVADMNMPVMDGIELTRLVRADPEKRNIPIIMATTESQSSQAELASRAGVNAFINKPFTKEALAAKIAEAL